MTVSMSAVWDRTTEFVSDHLGAIFAIAAVAIFVPIAIDQILTPLQADPTQKAAVGLLGLAFGLVSLWGQLAIAAFTLDPAIRTGGAFGRATRRLLPMVAIVVVFFVVVIVLTLPVIAIMMANGVDLARMDQPGGLQAMPGSAAGQIGLYTLLLVPVGLWLAARIVILSLPVVVAERRGLGAIGRAFRLSRGLALRIIGVLLLFMVVMWVSKLAAGIVFGSILRLLLEGEGVFAVANVLTASLVAVTVTIFTVIATVFAANLYRATLAREAAVPPAADEVPA